MAQIRNSLSMKLKGRAGAYTFYSSNGRQIARVSQNATNYGESARRSLAQQTRRVRWSNLVNFYKLTKGVLHGAFETKRTNESDYNAFMRKNLPLATVALTKEMAATGSVIPQDFLISEGSLPSLEYSWKTTESGLVAKLGLYMPPEEVYTLQTIGAFTGDVLAQNPTLREGMQISIIILSHTIREGASYAGVDAIEITLNEADTRPMSAVMKGYAIKSDDDEELVLPGLADETYFAVVLSDSTSGKLNVSTARLTGADREDEETYSSPEAVAAAIESYGLDPDRFLDSGDYNG